MNTNHILTLFDYNYWAKNRIMRAAVKVSPEQFCATNSSSYGSLRGTLVHSLSAELVWRKRFANGQPPFSVPVQADFPTPEALDQYWHAEETLMRSYLAGLTDANLESPIEYKNTQGIVFQNVLWGLLVHLVNHGTQHRSEAAAMLTDFNCSPGDIDFLVFLREKGM